MRTSLLIPLLVVLTASPALAQGLIIPDEPDIPPLALTKHQVTFTIDRQVATTTVIQDFLNNTERQLEAQYVFPIPKGASIRKFTMLMNGKETTGELVEKDKARQIYTSIVNRARDPGLLEYLGAELFRANIFPIAPKGTQTITIRYEEILEAENSLVSYIYRVRNGAQKGPTVNGEFRLEGTLHSAQPITNLYSPSHALTIERLGDYDAKIAFSQKHTTLTKDFLLYFGLSENGIGMNLITYRPDPKEPGHFMLLLSPRSKRQSERLVARDLVFVVDTSGSMAGEKIVQARNALKFCLSHLNDGDRLALVSFSTEARLWKKEWVAATDYRDAGLAWAEGLEAGGGTDIAGALSAALSYPEDPNRPRYIIFMTDGKPTLGETTDPAAILEKVRSLHRVRGVRTGSTRIFTWGVGYDVDTHLLDGIAEVAGGVSEYVKPEEDVAAKVAAFYGKASHPVLTNLALEPVGEAIQLQEQYPKSIPDLYAGGQLVILGRYTGSGTAAFHLRGRVNETHETFTYEASFAASELKNAFVESLWGRRRIGYLLDEIRLHGETKELVDEVIRLSVRHGIQTPYTSYLILEDGTTVANLPPGVEGGRLREVNRWAADEDRDKAAAQKLGDLGLAAGDAAAPMSGDERKEHNESADDLSKGYGERGGGAAVRTALHLKALKESEQSGRADAMVLSKNAAGTRFVQYRGLWVDDRFEAEHAVTCVKFGSDAYFKLIERHPELIDVFKLATAFVYVTAPSKVIVVSETGEETLTPDQIEDLFRS